MVYCQAEQYMCARYKVRHKGCLYERIEEIRTMPSKDGKGVTHYAVMLDKTGRSKTVAPIRDVHYGGR